RLVPSRYCLSTAPHSFPTRRSSDLGGLLNSCAVRHGGHPVRGRQLPRSTSRVSGACSRTMVRATPGGIREGVSSETTIITRKDRSEEHTSELQSREKLVCRPLLEKN